MRFPLRVLFRAAALFCSAALLRAQSSAVEVPEANPGRPTVSTPATLTPVGYLQFENGGLYAASSPEFGTRFGIDQVTKFTVAPRLQLLALTEPFVHAAGATGDALPGNRPGEVFAGLQGVVLAGEGYKPTVSLSYIRRLYESPAPEIDIGTFRQSALFLVSDDLGGFHFDINGIFTEQAAGTVRRGQFGQTLSVSHPRGRFTIAGELWHFTQPLTKGNAVGNLWALSYPIRKNLVVDAGFNYGLTSTSPGGRDLQVLLMCCLIGCGRLIDCHRWCEDAVDFANATQTQRRKQVLRFAKDDSSPGPSAQAVMCRAFGAQL